MAPRRALAGLLAAPVLVLAGCGDGSSVADPPVHSPPHSVATSDPPAHETAEHFIRRWAEAEKQMENTGETQAYLATEQRLPSRAGSSPHIRWRFYARGRLRPLDRLDGSSASSSRSHGDRASSTVNVDSAPNDVIESPRPRRVKHLRGRPAHSIN